MTGFPTSVTSSTSVRSMPASRHSSAVSFARHPRTARRQLLLRAGVASSRTTRGSSGPRRSGSAGSSRPAEASDIAGVQVAEVPGDRRRADVECDAERRVVEARPDRGDDRPVVHRDGDAPRATSQQHCCRERKTRWIDREIVQAPFALERVEQPARGRSAARPAAAPRPRRSGDGRPDRPRSGARRPPCARPAGTPGSRAARRSRVVCDEGGAAEPTALGEAAVGGVRQLGRGRRGQCRGACR